MIVDLTGKAISELLADAGVSAIVGQKVRGELGAGEGPPAVIVRSLDVSYSVGPGTRRLRLQVPVFAALCYGVTRPQASQLANAVVEAIELQGPRRDASGRQVLLSLVEGGGNVELDPTTKWPFATVTFSFVGGQRAVA